MNVAVAANSTRKIGSNIGGTSHSQMNLSIFDILTAFGRGGSTMLSVTGNSLGRAVISEMW
jgi:hypothetical protein